MTGDVGTTGWGVLEVWVEFISPGFRCLFKIPKDILGIFKMHFHFLRYLKMF